MAKDIKNLLAQKLAENSKRHAEAQQEATFEAGRQHVRLPVDQIDPNPYQPRSVFPQDELEALASSISESGLLQPVSVRAVGERYQLIAGERRWRAHKLLGRTSIEALVIPAEESDMAVWSLAENIDRADLSDYEIGKALRQVESQFPSKKKLAEALGLNREDMYRYYAFEALPDSIRARLDQNPRLLSRSAAAELKRLLQRGEDSTSLTALLEQAWEKLEAGELEQTKLAAHLAKQARTQTDTAISPPPSAPAVHHFHREGKLVASLAEEGAALVLKLHAFDDERRQKLVSFVEELVGSGV